MVQTLTALTLVDGTSVLRLTRACKGVRRNRCQQPSTPTTKGRFRRARGFSYSAALRLLRPDVADKPDTLAEPAATELTLFNQHDHNVKAVAHEGQGDG